MNAGFATASTLVLLPRFDAAAAVALLETREHHLLRRRADDVLGPAQRADRGASTSSGSPATCGSRCPAGPACPSRSSRRSRRGSACRSSRGTGCPRPRRWRRSATRTATRGRARSASRSGASRCKLIDDAWNTVEGVGRDRRDRDPRAQHHARLLQPARGDRRGDEGRLVPHRRPGPARQGRLLLHRRPGQGHDHPRRLQRLPAGDRGGPDDPRGGLARGGHRRPAPSSTARRSRRS